MLRCIQIAVFWTSMTALFAQNPTTSPSGTPKYSPVGAPGSGASVISGGGGKGAPVFPAGAPDYDYEQHPVGAAGSFGGGITGGSSRILAPMPHYWALVAAVLLLVFSLYVFDQSIDLQQLAFRGIDGAPSPRKGAGLVWLGCPLIVGILGLLTYWNHVENVTPWVDAAKATNKEIWGVVLFHLPLSLVPAFALSSLLPAALAAHKFMVVKSVARSRDTQEATTRFGIGSSAVGIAMATVNFAASIATLITFFVKNR